MPTSRGRKEPKTIGLRSSLPLQRKSKWTSLSKFFAMILALATVVGGAAAVVTFFPRITIEASGPFDPSPKPPVTFTIANTNVIPLEDVKATSPIFFGSLTSAATNLCSVAKFTVSAINIANSNCSPPQGFFVPNRRRPVTPERPQRGFAASDDYGLIAFASAVSGGLQGAETAAIPDAVTKNNRHFDGDNLLTRVTVIDTCVRSVLRRDVNR
jgi:hypothetical protein